MGTPAALRILGVHEAGRSRCAAGFSELLSFHHSQTGFSTRRHHPP
ncbi:hypothetical protein APY04_2573 [Hyphomicrobium sulfonivorans]|uniref:Uncharacterized protein n=1 Tax=Hyphomicrobium sulfonivorans TaxID=121290 RepID=A0A109BC15_HYPSL|nr:hypothetical protein APY04_2573 [Hyphomicrobium sulfonivorans]